MRRRTAHAALVLLVRAEKWALLACLLLGAGACDDAVAASRPRFAVLGKARTRSAIEQLIERSSERAASRGVAETFSEQNLAEASKAHGICPDGMLNVEGDYCRKVQHRCLEWMDPPGKFRRCKRYEQPARCSGARRHVHFCIDRDEFVKEGETLPLSHKSFVQATRICADAGKRICSESEWNFACEGEELRPYPYGFERDSSACNADRLDLAAGAHQLRDLRSAPGAYPRCASPFGARDMTGNLEELVARDEYPRRPALKGGHFLPGRNYCRARQIIHGPGYSGVETGFRCCKDANDGTR